MSYVIFLPVMCFSIADMAYQFTYSDYDATVRKSSGFCEEGDELSKMVLNVPTRPRVDGFWGLFVNGGKEQLSFSFKCPFKGSIIHNARPFSVNSFWHSSQRPQPGRSFKASWDAGFETCLLIDRPVEFRGIHIYSDLLHWMRNNDERLEAIAMKSSGYFSSWRSILDKEIRYLSSTICPVITYNQYQRERP